jgi:predicted RNA-binding Zn-ribbon protein involved in translation (DUF1610 family)
MAQLMKVIRGYQRITPVMQNRAGSLTLTGENRKLAMEYPAIFAATLGLAHPWQITAISFAGEVKRMDITIDLSKDCNFSCPTCGREAITCSEKSEVWFHKNFFRYETYLHTRVPRFECPCCGLLLIKRPWSRKGSKFILIN